MVSDVSIPALIGNAAVLFCNPNLASKEVATSGLEFEMQAINELGLNVISMEEFMAWKRGEKKIQDKSVLITIDDGNQFGSGFVDVNPNSKIPALMDHSTTKPTRVFESGAILLYLAEKFDAFLPRDRDLRAETLGAQNVEAMESPRAKRFVFGVKNAAALRGMARDPLLQVSDTWRKQKAAMPRDVIKTTRSGVYQSRYQVGNDLVGDRFLAAGVKERLVATPGALARVVDIAAKQLGARPRKFCIQARDQIPKDPLSAQNVSDEIPRVRALGGRVLRMGAGIDVEPAPIR